MSNQQPIEEVVEKREAQIVKVSIINIVVNVLLSIFKGIVGFLSHSVAIQADALNSLSDALAAVVTIIGIKLSAKAPNNKHPLGYGRYEYLSDGIVSFLVIYAAIEVFFSSMEKVFHKSSVTYDYVTIVVLVVAILVKIGLGLHEKKMGKVLNSKALVASGVDSISDSVVTVAVLISVGIELVFKINIEAYLGIIISCLILKTGIEMFRDTVDELLGKRVKGELISEIKETLEGHEKVCGAFDLVLHSYGPNKYIGSVHIEVPSTMSMEELDILERTLTRTVYQKHGVLLAGIGIYSVDVENEDIIKLREQVTEICLSYNGIMQLHGFMVDMEQRKLRFDLIVDFKIENVHETLKSIKDEILKKYPGYDICIQEDINIDL